MYRREEPSLITHTGNFVPGWKARLDIELTRKLGKTCISHVEHEGPLRIQRPFYPEGKEICHVYLLHPPGGMVTGDALNVCASLENGAHALFTTPSAGKIYRGNGSAHKQQQQVSLTLKQDSILEWLPQETIVFNGARGELFTSVDLQDESQVLLWDVVCLGRPASQEIFDKGYLVQKLLLRKNGKTIYRERNLFAGSDELLKANWCLATQPVAGTMLASCYLHDESLQTLREELAATVESGMLAVSQLPELLIARYVGSSVEECRRGFERVRDRVRPLLCKQLMGGEPTARPRIWNT